MIEILIMFFLVVPWFYRTARRRGRSPITWGIIGALSYYVPEVAMARWIVPAIKRPLTMDDLPLVLMLSIGVGVVCCILAGLALMRGGDRPSSSPTT